MGNFVVEVIFGGKFDRDEPNWLYLDGLCTEWLMEEDQWSYIDCLHALWDEFGYDKYQW
jgi:hypothetical protein